MQINEEQHKVVVVINDEAFGYTGLSTAVLFIEEVFKGENAAKLYNRVVTALGEDKEDDLQIWSIDEYIDLFTDEDDETSE